jgi:DNA-binding NarL/FixJ family response regulator
MNDKTGQKPRILIVDDDKEVLLSFQIWLEGEGFDPLSASNSGEALQILENLSVELVLLDFRLGTENGLEVAQMIKETDEHIKIIMITGYPSYDTAVESIKAGLFDYLSKGTPNEKILETIKKALRAREKELIEKGEVVVRRDVIKFAVICKHSLIKERLRNFSANYPDFKLYRAFNSIAQMEEVDYLPEIHIVMICGTCNIEGCEDSFVLLNALYRLIPSVKPVIFNEVCPDDQKVELIKSGVKGFFSIDMDSDMLEKALKMISKDEMWVSRRLVNMAMPNGPEYLRGRLSNAEEYGISSREKDILKAMVLGLKNKEIGDKLFISEMTVKSHINRIFKKFGVDNRARAIRFAMDKKLL